MQGRLEAQTEMLQERKEGGKRELLVQARSCSRGNSVLGIMG